MKNSKLSAWFWPILLILMGLTVLVKEVSQLRLYLDDNVWIFPSLLKEEAKHFVGYTYNFGLYRPLSNLIYYSIFDIYVKSPPLAHLLGLVLQITASILVYLILKWQKAGKIVTYLISLLILFLPFATESYMWLSGIPSLVAIIIFLLQVVLVLGWGINKKTFLFVFLLQVISVFNYESTFFFFIPFIYLFCFKNREEKLQSVFGSSCVLIVPNILWLVSKMIWAPHYVASRFQLIAFNLIPERFGLSFKNLFELFFSQKAINFYWLNNFFDGLSLISPLAIIVFIFSAGFIVFNLLFNTTQNQKSENPSGSNQVKFKNSYLSMFWLLCFFASLVPNILIKETSFSFRTLYLTIICLVIFISSLVNNLSEKMPTFITVFVKSVISVILLIFLILSVPGNLAIANSYTVNYYRELSVRNQIRDEIDRVTAPNDKINVYLVDYPVNLTDSAKYLHGEWLISCFNLAWCGKNIMAMATDKVDNIETNISELQSPYLLFNFNSTNSFPILSLESVVLSK